MVNNIAKIIVLGKLSLQVLLSPKILKEKVNVLL